jgi:hypothetical protein
VGSKGRQPLVIRNNCVAPASGRIRAGDLRTRSCRCGLPTDGPLGAYVWWSQNPAGSNGRNRRVAPQKHTPLAGIPYERRENIYRNSKKSRVYEAVSVGPIVRWM